MTTKPSRRPLKRGSTPRSSGPPEIETLTLNGFQILRPQDLAPSSHEHHFA
jgi:hypothetical protein